MVKVGHRWNPRGVIQLSHHSTVKPSHWWNPRGGDDLAELGKWWWQNPSSGGEPVGLGICDDGKWVGWNPSPIYRVGMGVVAWCSISHMQEWSSDLGGWTGRHTVELGVGIN
jgi:hypothetical protein